MSKFKEMPLLGTDKHVLIEAISSSGVKAVEMDGPMHKIPDGPVITAVSRQYEPSVQTVLQLVAQVMNPYIAVAHKFWILAVDHESRIVRFAVTDEQGQDITTKYPVKQEPHQRRLPSSNASQHVVTGAKVNVEFRNESEFDFTDISSEASRTYNFGQKGFVKIIRPLQLSVSPSGGHRIFTADGQSHYIPSGWIHLSWAVLPGQPNFVK